MCYALNIYVYIYIYTYLFALAKSPDRPGSARSHQGSTRQKLRHPNARHVNLIGRRTDISDAQRHVNTSGIWATTSSQANGNSTTSADPEISSDHKSHDVASWSSLKHLIFKSVDRNLVEVRTEPKTTVIQSLSGSVEHLLLLLYEH
jgi:hypothetical protein